MRAWQRKLLGLAVAVSAGWNVTAANAQDASYYRAASAAAVAEERTPLEQRVIELEQRLEQQQQQYNALRQEVIGPQSVSTSVDLFSAPADKAGDKGDKPKTKEFPVGADNKMSAVWKNGLELQSAGKDFRIHVGGRTQLDTVFYDASPAFANTGASSIGDDDSVNFRRARIRIDGDMYGTMDWCVEYDFVNSVNLDPVGPGNAANDANGRGTNVTALTDVWWTFKEVPAFGNVRIGNQKEPIGLEHLTSSRYLDFMERSFNQDLFTGPFNNGFTPGIAMSRTFLEERASANVGLYKNTNNAFAYGVGDGEYAVTGRLTWLPFYDEASNGRSLIHVGVSGSHRDTDENRVRFRSRASLRNGPGVFNPNLVDTGFLAADSQDLVGLEAAWVAGPMLLQAEYIGSYTHDIAGGPQYGTYYAHGYYVEALYFLTGEHREYENRFGGGAFGRVVPYENAFFAKGCCGPVCGKGAWQTAVRFNKADLTDSGINGGVVQDVTLGLNWFLNPNSKIQWNYVHTWRDAPGGLVGNGEIDGFGMRFAHDF
jgi:phosphate-selective porin OprO/OprP